jgi:hypothetical protein
VFDQKEKAMLLVRHQIKILVLLVASTALLPILLVAQESTPTGTPPDKRQGKEIKGKAVSGPPLRGNIKHRAVAELPLPRDRESFGIGEAVEFWIDPPDGEGSEAVIAWYVRGRATVYPVIGPATIVTVDLADEDGKFTVAAERRDPGLPAAAKKHASEADLRNWLRKQIAVLPKGDRQRVEREPPALPNYSKDLRAELSQLDGLRKGTDTSFAQLDELGRKLLEKYAGAKERGQVYYWLAHVHAQSGLLYPERVAEYASKALEYPLEPLQVPRLYVYWGDAEQVIRAKERLTDRRKWSALLYLAGLREVLRYRLPDKAPELPVVDALTNSDQAAEILRRHAQQVTARRFAEFQCAMVQHREVLMRQLASLYHRSPSDSEEVRELASGMFRNSQEVDDFLKALKKARWKP